MDRGRPLARLGAGSCLVAALLLHPAAARPPAAEAAEASAPAAAAPAKSAKHLADVNGDGVIRIGCLGDGNTAWRAGTRSWCELLIPALEKPSVEGLTLGRPGATATPAGEESAAAQLDRAVAANADAVILAFGAEDLARGKSPEEVAQAHRDLAEKAAAAEIAVFVAAIPRHPGVPNEAQIARTNELLAKSFPESIDAVGFEKRDFETDGTKLTWMGQVRRASRAYTFLVARID